jgi:hypothetical protein
MAELPAHEKQSHASVHYEHPSEHAGQYCADCVHFINAMPPRCEGVASPIRRQDWCVRFKEKK